MTNSKKGLLAAFGLLVLFATLSPVQRAALWCAATGDQTNMCVLRTTIQINGGF